MPLKFSRPKIVVAILATSALGLHLSGCKRGMGVSRTAYIVGVTNDILPVDRETEPKIDPPVLNASVMIATRLNNRRIKFCSGTLLRGDAGSSSYRVLTNHHCFALQDEEGKATAQLMPEACVATKAYFGFTGDRASAAFSTNCQMGSLRTNFDGDLAVFTLQQNPPEPHLPIELWDGDADAVGREALIIHYPDVEARMEAPPEGGVKLPTAAVTMTDCKVLGGFAINEWELDRTLPFSIRHTCDLIHGSSGSGLIDLKSGKLLGVNWGGIKISTDGGTRTDNVATRAKYAQAFLNFNVEEEFRQAEHKRAGQNSLSASNGGELKSRSQTLRDDAKKRCGVVVEDGGGSPFAWLFLALLVPVLTSSKRGRSA